MTLKKLTAAVLSGVLCLGISAAPAFALQIPVLHQDDDDNEPDPIPDGGWSDYDDGYDNSYDNTDSQSEPDPKPAPAAATPYIIVDSYSFGSDSVSSGQTFDLTISFKNTSNQLAVENIIMSIETEEGLSITSSSNTFYIGYLGPLASQQQTIRLKALGSDKSSSPAINISFRYEYVDNDTRQSQTSSEKISIPVVEPDRFEVTEPNLTDIVTVGQETVLSFQYVNKGKGTLNNISATVEGDVDTLQPVLNLGNFESGKSGQIDMVVIPKTAGETRIKVNIQYENASGEPVTLTYPITLDVQEPMMEDPFEDPGFTEPEPEPEKGSNWIWWVAGAAVLILIALFVWRHKKKKASNPEDEAYRWLLEETEKEKEAALKSSESDSTSAKPSSESSAEQESQPLKTDQGDSNEVA